MKNITKILIIALVSLLALGILMGTAEASHTFKKGGYKMKVTDKQYKKLKNSKHYVVSKKVGTKTKKYYQYKEIKTETYRTYYDKKGYYAGSRVFTHHNGYWGNINARWVGDDYEEWITYNGDGSYYTDRIEFETWRFTKTKKIPMYMLAIKSKKWYGDNKIHLLLQDHKDLCG